MMQIQENISLKPYNTFGIHAKARYFAKFTSSDELDELFHFAPSDKEVATLVLGGGSNILLTQDYKGLVAINEMQGIEVISQDEKYVYVRAAAGENWHRFVVYCIENNFAGVENLSLIWGSVGASPMQNIGAYGAEIKDVFHKLEAYNIKEKSCKPFQQKIANLVTVKVYSKKIQRAVCNYQCYISTKQTTCVQHKLWSYTTRA